MERELAWWQRGIVYEIYPRSFQDSDADGIGDLPGILARLDYLLDLGADAVWICPIQPSPMADFGYDIADYTQVDPAFGTLEDFDRLLAAAHGRGLRVILDFVPNHSSDQHPWFQESRSSRGNPRRDWYIWRDPAPGGGPPNNWLSNLGEPAWSLDPGTGQYYYHAFLSAQPDLNWRSPALRDAMLGVMRFWLQRGVDGFRVDAANYLIEDGLLRDDPPNPDFRQGMPPMHRLSRAFSADRPETVDICEEMRATLDEFPDRLLVGEVHLPPARLVRYYGRSGHPGFNLPFEFGLLDAGWQASSVAAVVDRYMSSLPQDAWPNWVLGNHDKHRVASRIGTRQVRVAAMLLLTLRGTPFLYYGDELGMEDVPIPPGAARDPMAWKMPGCDLGRDPERTPMPWDGSQPNAGFTQGTPWLPLGEDWRSRNVAAQRADPHSILNLYRRLIAFRRGEPALFGGQQVPLPHHGDVLAYERREGASRFAVALNLGGAEVQADLPGPGRIEVSTGLDREGETVGPQIALRADEGVLVRLAGD